MQKVDQLKKKLSDHAAEISNDLDGERKEVERLQSELKSAKQTRNDLQNRLHQLSLDRDSAQWSYQQTDITKQREVVQDLTEQLNGIKKSESNDSLNARQKIVKTKQEQQEAREDLNQQISQTQDTISQLQNQLKQARKIGDFPTSDSLRIQIQNQQANLKMFKDQRQNLGGGFALTQEQINLNKEKMLAGDKAAESDVQQQLNLEKAKLDQMEKTLREGRSKLDVTEKQLRGTLKAQDANIESLQRELKIHRESVEQLSAPADPD